MNTYKEITTWIINNKDSFLVEFIMVCVLFGITRLWALKKNVPKALNKLKKIKGVKYFRFILLYALPLGIIVLMIVDNTNEVIFKNVALFIIICVTLIFNILMSYINSIFRGFTQIIKKNNEITKQYEKNFEAIYSAVIELKKNQKK